MSEKQKILESALPVVLHVAHAAGGGVGQHMQELALALDGSAIFLKLVPDPSDNQSLILSVFQGSGEKLLDHLSTSHDELLKVLGHLNIGLVHFHHTVGLPDMVIQLPQQLGVDYVLTVHDYYWISGNPTLTNINGEFDGDAYESTINPNFPLPKECTPVKWRDSLRSFIENAALVIFPSQSARALFGSMYNFRNVEVTPHPELLRDVKKFPGIFRRKKNYTIGILGALSREKGADFLEGMAKLSHRQGANLHFQLIGSAYKALMGVDVSGRYAPGDLPGLMRRFQVDVLLFVSRCPETYCYTLSYAIESGLPIFAPTVGAFPERLAGRMNTSLYDYRISPLEALEQLRTFIKKLESGEDVRGEGIAQLSPVNDFYITHYINLIRNNNRINTNI